MPKLSVVIPAYNEEKRLGPHLSPVIKYLDDNYPGYELIIVDDGSSDNTRQTVERAIKNVPQAKIISYKPNKGKGYAIRQGVLTSSGSMVLFMDADLSTPLDQIPIILKYLEASDVVIGSRAIGKSVKKPASLFRRTASVLFDQVKYILVGLREFKDTQCGFKAFNGQVARKLFAQSKIDRFMFDAEILFLAKKEGMSIQEIPVVWADMPDSKVRFFEGVISMFRDLVRIRLLHS